MALSIRVTCTKCGSYLLSRFPKLQDDETITCGCGSDIPIDDPTRAKLNAAIENEGQSIKQLFIDLTCEQK